MFFLCIKVSQFYHVYLTYTLWSIEELNRLLELFEWNIDVSGINHGLHQLMLKVTWPRRITWQATRKRFSTRSRVLHEVFTKQFISWKGDVLLSWFFLEISHDVAVITTYDSILDMNLSPKVLLKRKKALGFVFEIKRFLLIRLARLSILPG